ncbi:class I SAM-dependent methyltransferase family protein [Bauldia sp.]|uniref:class I SAM-dependent methyltransferase family protein n=1 Tax=Bauldia sp. TaxID=2575872 RepID=UPI003BACB4DA
MTAMDLNALTRPLPAWHPKAWYYGLARGLLRSVGRLSKGVSIGLAHGFDSGVMLDHVYANRAEGRGFLGRLIDRVYLNAPGWAGIRNRGLLLERTVVQCVEAAADGRQTVRLVDLACGGGQYLLRALARFTPDIAIDATLRDYRPENIDKARANAKRLGVEASFDVADAFSDADLAELGMVDIAIVSGLHEIIDDDSRVERHFGQIARILRPDGTLLLTVQPDHPQAEFIARVLNAHTGKPWAMRLRPVSLTRRWLGAAGFVVDRVAMEPLGIFGVLQATKA